MLELPLHLGHLEEGVYDDGNDEDVEEYDVDESESQDADILEESEGEDEWGDSEGEDEWGDSEDSSFSDDSELEVDNAPIAAGSRLDLDWMVLQCYVCCCQDADQAYLKRVLQSCLQH